MQQESSDESSDINFKVWCLNFEFLLDIKYNCFKDDGYQSQFNHIYPEAGVQTTALQLGCNIILFNYIMLVR